MSQQVLEKTAAPAPAWEPKIVAFCCNYCAYAAADLAGAKRMQYPANIRVVHAPCTGKVEMEHILEAFEHGADGILIAGCLEGGCHFQEGNLRARKRVERLQRILDDIGLDGRRLTMTNLSAAMAPTFVQRVQETVQVIRELGPNPLKSHAEESKKNRAPESAGIS
jgi:coenzyme F420-reducing hydrogenase delta subunit